MPHKHKRKRDDDFSSFDLAPSSRAKPLAAYNKASIFTKDDDNSESSSKRRKANSSNAKKSQDDTPKAFARLMAWQATGKKPSGLDDGTSRKKKKKEPKKPRLQPEGTASPAKTQSSEPKLKTPKPATAAAPKKALSTTAAPQPIPKILPGETLANFSLRVDQTLPLNAIAHKQSNPSTLPDDLRAQLKKSQRTTKHNKRLQRMQTDWRAEETKLREKEADEKDEREDENEEENLLWSGVRAARLSRKGKKKRAGKADADDDPWKELEKKRREETKQKNLQDVVKAPPVLTSVKSKLKTRAEDIEAVEDRGGKKPVMDEDVLVDVSNVPNAVGSLRRREELNATRKAVIEGYRKLHGRRRGLGERLNLSKAAIMT